VLSVLYALIVGVLQGSLEWLPISSEGNLVLIITRFFGFDMAIALQYSIFLHFGTGTAALIYFRKEIFDILMAKDEINRKLRLDLLVINLITGAAGLPIYLLIEASTQFGETVIALTGIALITMGLIQRNSRVNGFRDHTSLTRVESIILGLSQGLAVVPGISRSGITTATLLFMKNSSESAFKLSFLMSIPASFAASVGLFILERPTFDIGIYYSILAAFCVGYLTIDLLLKLAKKINFWKIMIGLGLVAFLSYLSYLL
jgi:undecaprenyl-diphosphatase